MRRLLPLLVVMGLLLSACDGDDAETANDNATGGAGAAASEGNETRHAAGLPGGDLVPCETPAGFTLSRPATWSTNSGDVVPACSLLHPEPFDVPRGTDARVAAISAYVDPVAFEEVAAPDAERDAERAATAIHGLQAVRLEYETGGEGLWPAGTPITMYVVDLPDGDDGRPRTFFLDTVGIGDFDYDRNQVILDRIAHTVRFDMEDVTANDAVVARHGGAGGFTVEGQVHQSAVCLRVPPGGDPVCTEEPAGDGLRVIELRDLQTVLAGVTGDDVFRVTAERRDGTSSTVLPAPIPGSDTRGFALTFPSDDVRTLRLFDVTGRELGTAAP